MPHYARAELNGKVRESHVAKLASTSAESPLDLLIIGGGINGAGAAFDAASRGLRVGVIESHDWAFGTSSRSSKLMHGGLRYLQMLDFSLVAEALRERDLLLKTTAPHLVKPVKFVFPVKNIAERGFIGSGIALYDAMQIGHRAVPHHRHVFPASLAKTFPGLSPQACKGAIEYYDAQMDDARFVMMLIRSAVNLGAQAVTSTACTGFIQAGARVAGAHVRDELTGQTYDIHARNVLLAGGVWTGKLQNFSQAPQGLDVLASKGIHITVPKHAIEAKEAAGIITQTATSVLFIIPWDEYWLIGTTDTPWNEDVTQPVATSTDIDYVLEQANAVLTSPLTREDIIGVFAGLRPLLQPAKSAAGGSAKVSREHTVMQVQPGLSAVAGGKFTTYRAMAEDAVNFALRELPDVPPTKTTSIPVIGGAGFEEMRLRAGAFAKEYGIEPPRLERLLFRYGALLDDLIELIEHDASLATPLEEAPRYLRAEIVYAARAEGALHLADVMLRRTRLEYEVKDRGVAAAYEIADLLQGELGWDEERKQSELESYRSFIHARCQAEETQSDKAALSALAYSPEYPQINETKETR